MLDKLLHWDTALFNLINHHRCDFADWVMALFSYSLFIDVIVVLITFFIIWQKKFKYWYIYVLLIAVAILLADRISVICFKDVIQRLRPSHALVDSVTLKLQHWQLIDWYKGGKYGFVSSHAANIFAVISFAFLVLRKQTKYFKIFIVLALLWALLTCYSRVYCGFHYPLDVICGSLVGIFVGLFVFYIYRLLITKLKLELTKQMNNNNE